MATRKGSGTKTKGLKNHMPGARGLGVRDMDDDYIKKLMDMLNIYDADPLVDVKDGQTPSDLEMQEDLEIIRYAFTLLRMEYGIVDFSKINPYMVVACARAALTDRQKPKSAHEMLNAFKNFVHIRNVHDKQELDLMLEEEQKHKNTIANIRLKNNLAPGIR